jgi:nicotinamidase/pyrazinamidase
VAAYDPHTPLVVVDVQNDFVDPRGSLFVPGGDTIVPEVNAQVARAQAAGAPILYTADWHPPETPHFAAQGGIWPVHCVAETWGAAFHPSLVVDGVVVRKGHDGGDGYSGFSVRDPLSGDVSATLLDDLLREHGAEAIVIVGVATDYCVVETACDGRMLGYRVDVARDAIAAVDLTEGDGDRAITRMRDAGVEII